MKKREAQNTNVPTNVPRWNVKSLKLHLMSQYTEPKLFIPKDDKGKPTLKKYWYVYYYYRNPDTGIFDNKSKFNEKRDINRLKTVKERKEYGRILRGALTKMLENGYNPYTNTMPGDVYIPGDKGNRTITQAIRQAISDKKLTWGKSTADNIILRAEKFLEYADRNHFSKLPAKELERSHVGEFLKTLSRNGSSATNVNNYRASLSSVFSQMVENGDIKMNYVQQIKKLKSRPVKNHPFTPLQVKEISTYLKENDPYLLDFIRMLSFTFLRNREVLRLRVRDIDLVNNTITDKTKTKALEKIYIIDQVKEVLNRHRLTEKNPDHFLFTKHNKPAEWDEELKKKVDHFGRRFKKVREHFKLGREYGIYSFRHTFAINVFENFVKQGLSETEALSKMLPITRHSNIDTVRLYIREKKQMLPKNFTDNITIEF